jgi:hypothetical protein
MIPLLAVLASSASAQETVKSEISGNVTLKFESKATAEVRSLTEEQKKLQACETRWTEKFADNKKGREQAEMQRAKTPSTPAAPAPKLTRADYRACMYACLGDRAC